MMPVRLLLRIALLAMPIAGMALAADGWRTYHNERFGTTADVPADWQAGPPPANADGLVFTAPDGQASITVSGSLNVWDSIDEAMAIYEAPLDGETITYKHRTARSIVVSGTRADRIFYRKSILSCGDTVWNSVALDYPAADKRAFDPLVVHVAGSLRAGAGWQTGKCD